MSVLRLHSEPMKDEWLDHYGHLNEAYYLVPFSNTTWILQDYFGVGVDYFKKTGCAIYTLETHMRYLNDVRKPAVMNIESLIFRADPKKFWFAHQMVVDENICATAEFMVLHYDTNQQRTTAMPDEVLARLQEAQVEYLPEWAGRRIGMKKQ